jgi:hypothetical protein
MTPPDHLEAVECACRNNYSCISRNPHCVLIEHDPLMPHYGPARQYHGIRYAGFAPPRGPYAAVRMDGLIRVEIPCATNRAS